MQCSRCARKGHTRCDTVIIKCLRWAGKLELCIAGDFNRHHGLGRKRGGHRKKTRRRQQNTIFYRRKRFTACNTKRNNNMGKERTMLYNRRITLCLKRCVNFTRSTTLAETQCSMRFESLFMFGLLSMTSITLSYASGKITRTRRLTLAQNHARRGCARSQLY
jgi:hypothetical protein